MYSQLHYTVNTCKVEKSCQKRAPSITTQHSQEKKGERKKKRKNFAAQSLVPLTPGHLSLHSSVIHDNQDVWTNRDGADKRELCRYVGKTCLTDLRMSPRAHGQDYSPRLMFNKVKANHKSMFHKKLQLSAEQEKPFMNKL